MFQTEDTLALTVLRITLGTIVLFHGLTKVSSALKPFFEIISPGNGIPLGFEPFARQMATVHGMPVSISLAVVILETLGSVLMILGLAIRPLAFLIFCLFVAIIGTVHWQFGFFMNYFGQQKGEGFEFHLLILAVCVALFILGGGKYSLDRMLTEQHKEKK